MVTLTKPKSGLSFILLTLLVLCSVSTVFGQLDLSNLISLDDSAQIKSSIVSFDRRTGQYSVTVTTTNISGDAIASPIYLVIDPISPPTITVANATGVTTDGKPYFTVLSNGSFKPGDNISVRVAFANPQRLRFNFSVHAYGVPAVVRAIEFAEANPDKIFVCQPTNVTVTVQIGAEVELIVDQIYLLQLDDTGAVLTNFGRMYDDGTHGDLLVGDGTFTTRVVFHGTVPEEIRLIVEVHYIAPPIIDYSDLIIVNVLSPLSPEMIEVLVNEVLFTNASASQEFQDLASQMGDDQARQMVLDSLQFAIKSGNCPSLY